MLKGFDTSHHQNDNVFYNYLNKCDFMIIKATEGKTYKDTTFCDRAKYINDIEILNGFYHYARPENNSPKEEFDNFKKTIHEYVNNFTLLFLDWEGNALNHSFDWALTFCKLVSEEYKRPCIIYASASTIKKYSDKYKYWWTAHYNINCDEGCEHDNANELLVQYSNTPIDTDTFLFDRNKWLELCGNKTTYTDKVLFSWIENNKEYIIIERVKND